MLEDVSVKKQFIVFGATLILNTPNLCSTLVPTLVTQSKATAELVPAAKEGDLVTVQNCLSKEAIIDTQDMVRSLFACDLV